MRSTQSFEGHSKKMHTRGLSTEQEVLNIILIQGRGKESKMVGGNLLFFKKEIKHLVHPYYDSLVVTLQVANTKVHKIHGRHQKFCGILFMDVWKQIRPQHPLNPMKTPLFMSSDKPLIMVRSVELLVNIRKGWSIKTLMINFLAANCPLAYNCILGQLFLHVIKEVSSNYHISLKFPI